MKTYKIAIGSDHAGFKYKEAIKAMLLAEGHAVGDFGAHSCEPCDYPDFVRLELDLAQMRGEVKAAAEAWYERARIL